MTRDRRRNLAPVDQPLTEGELAEMERRASFGWNVSSIDVRRATAEIRQRRAAEITSALDCGCCGASIPPIRADGMYSDDDPIVCSDCGAKNEIGIDDGDDEDCSAHVVRWWCKHGSDDDTPCDQCEIEEGIGVGEVAP